MHKVCVEGNAGDVRCLLQATAPQSAYLFTEQPNEAAITLRLIEREGQSPFVPRPPRAVNLCTWQSADIARYAGVPRADYLFLLAMLGLTQLQALRRNPTLIAEDIVHGYACGCLFERRPMWDGYAVLLERPHLCARCSRFYSALCAREEMNALRAVVQCVLSRMPRPLSMHAAALVG